MFCSNFLDFLHKKRQSVDCLVNMLFLLKKLFSVCLF